MKKKTTLFNLLAVAVFAMAGSAVWAEDEKPAAAPAAPTVVVGGLVDGYYTYNFTNADANMNGAGNNGTFFNNADNSYTLGLAELSAVATQGHGSAHLVLAYGQEGNLGLFTLGIDVLQAYVSYNAEQFTFNFGRFATWMGNEVIESKGNWNYSRSLLFWYTIPLWHTGFSANFTSSDSMIGATFYVTNGWNNVVANNNAMEKTFGLQLMGKPDPSLSIILNGILGPDPWSSTDSNLRGVGELIVSWAATDKFSLALDVEAGGQGLGSGSTPSTATFWGVDLYARYQIETDWAAALRLEEVKDDYGVLGLYAAAPMGSATDIEGRDITLTLEHNFTPNLLMRVEGRYDYALSGGTEYSKTTTPAGPFAGGSGNQFTTTGSVVFSF